MARFFRKPSINDHLDDLFGSWFGKGGAPEHPHTEQPAESGWPGIPQGNHNHDHDHGQPGPFVHHNVKYWLDKIFGGHHHNPPPPPDGNDAPNILFAEQTGQVPEGDSTELLTLTGAIKFIDKDFGDTHTATAEFVSTTHASGMEYGGLEALVNPGVAGGVIATANPGANWSGSLKTAQWSYAVDDADIQHLAEGETVLQTYRVTVTDAAGAQDSRLVTIRLQGSNDAPTASAVGLVVDASAAAGLQTLSRDTGPFAIADFDATDVDSDDDRGTLTYEILGQASVATAITSTATALDGSGTIINNNDGTFSFDPGDDFDDLAEGETRDVTFSYRAVDRHGAVSNEASITITVRGTAHVNEAPVVADQSFAVPEESEAGAAIGIVLATDADSTDLSYAIVGGNEAGLFEIDAATGAIRLAQGVDDPEVGSYALQVAVGDGDNTTTATATVEVTPVNDAPVAADGAATTAEDAVLTGSLPAATDAENDDVAYALGRQALNGTVIVNADGSYSYTPNPDFNGADSFSYVVSDGNGGANEYEFAVTVTPVDEVQALPDANSADPVIEAGVDAATGATVGDATATGNALDNDTGQGVSVVGVASGLASGPQSGGVGTAIAGTYGALTLGADGQWTYTLDDSNAATEALAPGQTAHDVFSYTIAGENGDTSTTSLIVAITGSAEAAAPVPPRAVADINIDDAVIEAGTEPDGTPIPGDSTAQGNALANDEGQGLAVVGVAAGPLGAAPGTGVGATIQGTYGTLTLGANGLWSYQLSDTNPATEALGQGQNATDVFSYTIEGANGQTSTAQLFVVVSGSNDEVIVVNTPPTANPDTNDGDPVIEAGIDPTGAPTDGDPTAAGNVLDNDADPDLASGDVLSVVGVVAGPTAPGTHVSGGAGGVIDGTYGTLSLRPDGGWDYTLDNDRPETEALAQGQQATEVFTYTVSDEAGERSTTTLSIVITGSDDQVANRAPVVGAPIGHQTTAEEASFNFQIPAGAFNDPDGDTLTYSATLVGGGPLPDWLHFDPDPAGFVGTPDDPDLGTIDVIVRATDPSGEFAEQIFRLTVTPVNDDPVANDDTATAVAGTPVIIDVLANDSDADGDPLGLTTLAVTNGNAILVDTNDDGFADAIEYTPAAGFAGTATITYGISDGNGGTDTGTVTVAVGGGNQPPMVLNPIQDQSATEEAQFRFDIPADTFADPDGDPLTYAATLADGSPLPSWLHFDPDPAGFVGIPDDPDVGVIVVRVTATDPAGFSVQQDFAIDVTPVNDAPMGATLIGGEARIGEVLTADVSSITDADGIPDLDGDGDVSAGDVSFQWEALVGTVWTIIDGATASTFTPEIAQQGQSLRVTASYTDNQGFANSVTSDATDQIAAGGRATISAPASAATDEDTVLVFSTTTAIAIQGVDPALQLRLTITALNGEVSINPDLDTDADGIPDVDDPDDDSDGEQDTEADFGPSITIVGTAAEINAQLAGMTYTPSANYNGPESLSYDLTDADGAPLASTAIDVTVMPVNDLPIGQPTVGGAAQQGAELVADLATFSDADGIVGPIAWQWQFSADGTGSVWDDIPGATNSTYTPGSGDVGFQLRVVGTYTDGGGTVETVISEPTDQVVSGVSQAPVLSGIDATPLAYIENDGAAAIAGLVTITDPDSGDAIAATVSIAGYVEGEDVLSFTPQGGATGSFNSTTGELTISASPTVPLVLFQAMLRSVTYENISDNPTDATRTLSFTVTDRDGNTSAAVTRDITVMPVNDAPVVADQSFAIDEGSGVGAIVGAIQASDLEGEVLRFIPSGDTGPFTVDVNSGQISLAQAVDDAEVGSYTFAVDVMDRSGDISPAQVTVTVNAVNDDPAGAPVVNGAAQAGLELTADVAMIADADGIPDRDGDGTQNALDFTFQWEASPDGTVWTAIPAAIGSSLTPGSGQVGQQIRVVVSYVDGQGFDESVASLPTAAVAAAGLAVNTLDDEAYDGGTLADELADGGGLSLREAVGLVNAGLVSSSDITFDQSIAGGQITVAGGLTLAADMTIDGGSAGMTIASDGTNRVLTIDGGTTDISVSLNALTITGGGGASLNRGGGVRVTDGDEAVITNSLIVDNFSRVFGAGIGVDAGGTATLTNTTVAGNNGAGAYAVESEGDLTMINSTVTGNARGVAIRAGTTTTTNSIVLGNEGPEDFISSAPPGSVTFTGLSIIGEGNDTDPSDGKIDGVPQQVFAAIDPATRGGALADNGGPTQTVALLDASINPALDAAIGGTDTDQRGVAAFDNVAGTGDSGNNRDIGAYETATFVSHAPIAADDAFTGAEDNQITGNLLSDNGAGEDSDPDGDVLSVIAGTIATAQGGSVAIASDGSFIYTPAANFNGTDSFDYRVTDGALPDTGTVTLTVTPVADAPAAIDDAFTGRQDSQITGNVLDNNGAGADYDPDGDTLTVTAFAAGNIGGGGITVNEDGSFIYTPAAGFTGTESFNYTVKDAALGGLTDTGRITFTVVPNAAPVAVADAYSLAEDTTLNIAALVGVLANDSDANGDALSAILVDDVTNGSLTLNADGSFNYMPDPHFNGPDSFTYKTNDGLLDGNTVTVDLTVNPVDDPEAIIGDRFGAVHEDGNSFLGEGTLIDSGSLSISDVDGDLSSLDFVPNIINDTGYGSFSINADGDWQFILDNSSSQVQALAAFSSVTRSFTVESADGSLSETVRITINGWNDAASISGDSTGEVFVAGYAAGPLNFAPLVSGQLQVSDADAGESIFGSIEYLSSYGTFTYTPAGSWIFDLDEQNQDVIDLGSNETLTETFTLTSLDGTASEDVVITIHRVILVELEPFAATTTPDTGTLTGTPENDHFVYHLGDGPVTITDFEPGPQNQGQIIDQIELAGFGVDFATLDTDGNQLLDQMDIGINGDATSITLDLGNGDTLTVANVTTLMEDDLLFS